MTMETHSTPADQTKTFLEGEGDRWYERNKEKLADGSAFFNPALLHESLSPFQQEINTVLEIGCGNGLMLSRLCQLFQATGEGIDPSAKAISEGGRQFGRGISLRVGTANELPFAAGAFDLVHFGFCLYLVDRRDLLRAVSEADRVLRPGGFLSILDFDPNQPHKRPYHHKPGVFSYKQRYSDLFTAGHQYHLVSKHSLSHAAEHFAKDPNDRVALSVLYKETTTF